MPTINELPVATSVSAADEVVVSQSGTTRSASVGTLLAGTQPAILAPTGSLLGRESLGPGGPEPITVGTGLDLTSSVLQANGTDHASFPLQTTLQPTDEAVLNSNGTPMLLQLSLLRGLFSPGANITIDASGVISSASGGSSSAASGSASSIAALPEVISLAATDLVAVSQNSTDHAITYANLLDGETIDEFTPAAPAADTDTFPIGQGTSTMLAQTFAAVWTWIAGHLPGYRQPVVEITENTTLDSSAHNGHLLVCSAAVTLTHSATEGSGFACTVINASSGNVTLDSGITTTSGISALASGQMASIYCVAYSAGTSTFAWISGPLASPVPGQVAGLTAGAIAYSAFSVSWGAPLSGGAATSYTVQYRVTGTSAWTSQAALVTNATIVGLAASTEYDVQVIASNAAGNGVASNILNVTTTAAPTIVPGQVTGLTITGVSTTAIGLSWTGPTSGGAVGSYTVQYRVTGQSSWITYATNITTVNDTVTGLASSTGYDFQVYAVNSAGTGTPSGVASGTTTVPAPATPTALAAVAATQTTVVMSWTAPASGGPFSSYTLQYRVTGSAGSWSQQSGISTTSYTLTGLATGTEYDVQVAAVNTGGVSAFTATTNATTVIATPGTPTGLTAGTATTTSQPLSWATGSGGTPATFNLRYGVHPATSWTTVSGITGTTTSITGLTANTSYDYQVQAVNAGGASAWSGSITASTAAVSNYLLTPGIYPAAGSTYVHGSTGNAFLVNINTSSGDGSYTQPAMDQYGWSTSNTVPPSTWANMTAGIYPAGGHNYDTTYGAAPATAGTYYMWFQALNGAGTVVFQLVLPYSTAVT